MAGVLEKSTEQGLRANWTTPDPNNIKEWHKGEAAGWFVSAFHEGKWWIASYRFGRQEDAEAAVAALQKAGITSAELMLKAGGKKCFRIMAEAMQW